MKVVRILFWIVVVSHSAGAQRMIDNRLNVQLSYTWNTPMGDEWKNHDNYLYPSFINNFQSGSGVGVAASYKVVSFVVAEVEASYAKFSTWTNSSSTRFVGSSMRLTSLNPRIGLITPFSERGILNRISLSVSAGPSFGVNKIALDREVFFPDDPELVGRDLKKSTTSQMGFSVSSRLNVFVVNKMYLGISYCVSSYSRSSALYDDDKMTIGTTAFHVGIRMKHNKRFKYAP